jgi:ribosomal protein L16/L10AE
LKDLFKQVMNSVGDEGLVTQKKAPAALHYAGPATHWEPGFVNVQIWMVEPMFVSNDQMKACRQNREGFMSMEQGVLLRVFNRAQEVANKRKEEPMDGGEGDDEAEM